jgi:hypothetical protein
MRSSPARVAAFFLLTTCLPGVLATPATGEQPEDGSFNLHYAFANQLGSGIYDVKGNTVQIYRLAGSLNLVSLEDHDYGLRLILPVTLGFFNFRIEDILVEGIPDYLSSLTFVPTLEFTFRARSNWLLQPFLGAGVGKEFSQGELSLIYALGLQSTVLFPWGKQDLRLGNRLVYTGYTTENLEFVDDFGMFETGLDVRGSLGFRIGKSEIDGSIFGVNYLYFASPHLLHLSPREMEMRTQWELGATVGTVLPWKILGIRMPRLGASYRFGSGPDAIRVVLGNPFHMSTSATGPAVQ